MRKTTFHTLLAATLLLGFPVLLWYDIVLVGRNRVDMAPSLVMVVPTSASTTMTLVQKLTTPPGILAFATSTSIGVSTSSLVAPASLAVQKSPDASPVSSTDLANAVFSVAPGFGGGGEVAGTVLASSLGNGTSGSGGSGRDFNDETCPLIDQSDFPQP